MIFVVTAIAAAIAAAAATAAAIMHRLGISRTFSRSVEGKCALQGDHLTPCGDFKTFLTTHAYSPLNTPISRATCLWSFSREICGLFATTRRVIAATRHLICGPVIRLTFLMCTLCRPRVPPQTIEWGPSALRNRLIRPSTMQYRTMLGGLPGVACLGSVCSGGGAANPFCSAFWATAGAMAVLVSLVAGLVRFGGGLMHMAPCFLFILPLALVTFTLTVVY